MTRAGEFETISERTTWDSFRRCSSFEKRSEAPEGIVESVEYAEPVEAFLPLLVIGQLAHIGKQAVFGLG
ncbi:MAG: hypothetical protein AVDCRST_MAG28-3755 [uncultured Rubrobacteraceae bacterium]|uniref:CRISPR-associated protein Cas6 C-terminal domain-containing protein n=1 Tax=uncultured Rubrobacteraceae bacterium TaxID=349277 RepID=A0A6J4R9P1_9ACTN|nr:MAG: hypothetical protein AVDCRST_MAG28-3755 [uncultured Rubrobacteraceae bacterium]